MMGGKKVIVTGPCYSPSDTFECKFGDITVPGTYIDATNAMCVTPLAGYLGRIPFSVTTDGGSTYSHNGTFVYCKICLSSIQNRPWGVKVFGYSFTYLGAPLKISEALYHFQELTKSEKPYIFL